METNNLEVDKAEETAAEDQRMGKSTRFEKVKNIIADKLHSVAERFGENEANQGAESEMAKYGKQASKVLDETADYIRKFDYEQADAKVRQYVAENPKRCLLIAGGMGLIIGAIFRRR